MCRKEGYHTFFNLVVVVIFLVNDYSKCSKDSVGSASEYSTVSIRAILSAISLEKSYRDSMRFVASRFGLVIGDFGLKIVQQSSYGRMEISYVPISREISIISCLSIVTNGRRIG